MDGQKEEKQKTHFDEICERYRAMMKSNENKPFSEQREAINKFRAGII